MFSKLAVAALVANVSATTLATANQKQIEVAELYQGMTAAYGAHFNVEALLACVGEEDKAALMFDAVYSMIQEAIQSKDYVEIIPALIFIFAGVQQVKQGLPACEAVITKDFDYKHFQADMKLDISTKELVKLAEKIIVKDLLEKFLNAYSTKDYATAGEAFGELIKRINEAKNTTAVATTPAKKVSKNDIAEVAQGFLEATNVGTFNFTALLICIYEADQEAEVLDAVYHMLKDAIAEKDIGEGIGAIIGIVAFVQGLQQVIQPCEAVDTTKSDWSVVNNIISTLQHPKDNMSIINENIMLHGRDITKDVVLAVDAWSNKKYATFGKNIGATLKETCAKEESPLFLY